MTIKRTLFLALSAAALAFVFLLALGLALPFRRDHSNAATAAANLYLAGHYAEAAQLYEQLLSREGEDSAVYFNLGNSYYQMGDYQQALRSYERAAALAPRDGEVRAGLERARVQSAAGASEELPGAVGLFANRLSLNELALLTLASWLMLVLLLLAVRLLRGGRGRNAARAALVAAVLVFLFCSVILAGRLSAAAQEAPAPGFNAALALDADVPPPLD